jgi:hypothetical protein
LREVISRVVGSRDTLRRAGHVEDGGRRREDQEEEVELTRPRFASRKGGRRRDSLTSIE